MTTLLLIATLAHHSFAAEFDQNKTIVLKGAVTKVEWFNPHMVYLDVKNDQGVVQRWQCEGGAPNTLTRNGWTKDSLKPGDEVSVAGISPKPVQNCNASS